MAGLAFLILGVLLALTSRVLLFAAALGISVGWAFGVWIPFGPILFRLCYPDQVHRSRMFGLASLPCFFLALVLGPSPVAHYRSFKPTSQSVKSLVPFVRYSMEKPAAQQHQPGSAGPQVQLAPSLEERRGTNTREFQRLRTWNETLKLKKRDLLRSDKQGNVAYNAELAQYNAALAQADAERTTLWPSAK